jgi:hypothetical protein
VVGLALTAVGLVLTYVYALDQPDLYLTKATAVRLLGHLVSGVEEDNNNGREVAESANDTPSNVGTHTDCRKVEPGGSPAQGQRSRRSTDRWACERRQPYRTRHQAALRRVCPSRKVRKPDLLESNDDCGMGMRFTEAVRTRCNATLHGPEYGTNVS